MSMTRENEILQFLNYHPGFSRSEIKIGMQLSESPATVKRILASLLRPGHLLQCLTAGTHNDGTEYRHLFSERDRRA